MTDVRPYAANLRVEIQASSPLDAKDCLEEICSRLFGEECIVVVVVPDGASIRPVRET